METPLVDAEGFPRADLDIMSIRKARNSIACAFRDPKLPDFIIICSFSGLTNDRKSLTEEIEKLLLELHEEERANAMDADNAPTHADSGVHRTTNRPFLKVESALYGSPAYDGGLVADDLVVQCGPIHGNNFEGLDKLSATISEHIGVRLVSRKMWR